MISANPSLPEPDAHIHFSLPIGATSSSLWPSRPKLRQHNKQQPKRQQQSLLQICAASICGTPPATPSDVGDDGLPPPLLDPGSDTPRQPALKRPASSSLPKAKAKAKAKSGATRQAAAAAPTPKASPKTEAAPKARAKAKAKAINIPPGVTLGCRNIRQKVVHSAAKKPA